MEQLVTGKWIEENFTEKVNGPLYIPVIGDLLPRIWGDVRTTTRNRYLISCGKVTFEVTRELFDRAQIGEHIDLGAEVAIV